MQDCFKLLHFHLGSQITNIRIVKGALNEGARVYTELAKLGAGLQYLDVGGGLGVDYDGSQTNFESSMNYTLEEYANDVVYHIQTRVRRGGRARTRRSCPRAAAPSVAYHSVLVFNVLGVSGFGDEKVPAIGEPGLGAADRRPGRDLQQRQRAQRARGVSRRAAGARHGAQPVQRRLPAARAAQHGREPVLGDLHQAPEDRPDDGRSAGRPAEPRRAAVRHLLLQLLALPVDSRQLGDQAALPGDADPPAEREAARTTPCSATSPATRTASSIASSTAATSRRRCRSTRSTADDYYLGVFLVGAYQEILGDLHNLFGDTHAVHVSLDEHGEARLDTLIKGDTVKEVLDYVEFDAETLLASCGPTSRRRSAKAGWTTKAPAASCGSTKTACTATPTWKVRPSRLRAPATRTKPIPKPEARGISIGPASAGPNRGRFDGLATV